MSALDVSTTSGAAVEPEGNGNGAANMASVLGQLKARAALQQQVHTHEMSVGGEFGDTLKIKYKVLEEGGVDTFIAKRQAMDTPQMTSLTMTFMAQACICLIGYDETGEHSWVLEDNQGPVRLEHRLLELLEMVPPNPNPQAPPAILTAPEVIMIMFGKNAMSIVQHGDELMTWMGDPSKKQDVGKSSGATGAMSSPSALSVGSTPTS
jgi:hypothetical protein